GGIGADIAEWVRVPNYAERSGPAIDFVTSSIERGGHPIGLPRNQVQRAWSRGAKRGAEMVVVHGEMLRVVPHRRHGVAVVVAQVKAGRTGNASSGRRRPGSPNM